MLSSQHLGAGQTLPPGRSTEALQGKPRSEAKAAAVVGTTNPAARWPERLRPRGPNLSLTSAAVERLPEQLGLARDIWIGLRTDGQAGEGTLASPFNGSGEGFDAKLRELCVTSAVTHIVIHLLPGTYHTRGYPHWFPRAGWKIQGAGMHQTTLKLLAGTNAPLFVISPFNLVEADGVEVCDLTVDCAYSPTNWNFATAVYLWGSHNAIRRVRAINAYGPYPTIENFTLGIAIGLGPHSEDNVIEDCEVSSFHGGYVTAISIGGGYELYNTKTIQGALRRNRVLDLYNPDSPHAMHAYGFSGAEGVVEGNLAVRCGLGFYIDTGRGRNLILRNNLFLACKHGGIAIMGRHGDTVVIENNFIELDTDAGPVTGLAIDDGGGLCRFNHVQIRHNVIRPMARRFSRGAGLSLSLAATETLLVTGNRIDAGLSNFIQDGGRGVFFDNTDFAGQPLPVVGGLTGTHVHVPRGEVGTLLLDKGPAYVVVQPGADPAANGINLIQAVARAKATRPHGQPLSASNRVTVLLFPGRYVLPDSGLVLDVPFVGLVGLANPEVVRLESEGNVLVQMADEVWLENLTLHCTATAPAGLGPQDKAAYFPADNLSRTVVRRCIFSAANQGWSMRLGITYAGFYEDCVAGPRAWGGPGNFAGRAVNCQAGPWSFGAGGLFSGFATNCTAGPGSFGAGGTGFHGYAQRCTAGADSFGGSGLMLDCEVTGAVHAGVPTTGRLLNCRIGPAPPGRPALVVGPGAVLYNCTVLADPASGAASIEAPQPVTATIGHCRLNAGLRNVINTLAEPFNIEDPNLN